MLKKSRLYSITAGSIAFLLGLAALLGILSGQTGGAAGFLIVVAALLLSCGLFGVTGGILLGIRLRLARALLLVAALIGLPLGFIFFMIFMYARKGTLRLLDNDAFRSPNIGAAP